MPNPAGQNQFGVNESAFRKEPVYGAKKQMEDMRRAALMAGQQGAASAVDTPRRSKRRAVRAARQGVQQVARAGEEPLRPQLAAAPSPAPELPYKDRLLAVWTEIGYHPEASDLAREMFERVRQENTR